MIDITTTWRGLSVTGTYDRDPGVRTWANGDPGYPPCTDVDMIDVDLDDDWNDDDVPDALVDVADYVGTGAHRIACGACKVLGYLPACVADWFKRECADELADAIADEAESAEGWFDEDRDRDED